MSCPLCGVYSTEKEIDNKYGERKQIIDEKTLESNITSILDSGNDFDNSVVVKEIMANVFLALEDKLVPRDS